MPSRKKVTENSNSKEKTDVHIQAKRTSWNRKRYLILTLQIAIGLSVQRKASKRRCANRTLWIRDEKQCIACFGGDDNGFIGVWLGGCHHRSSVVVVEKPWAHDYGCGHHGLIHDHACTQCLPATEATDPSSVRYSMSAKLNLIDQNIETKNICRNQYQFYTSVD